MANFMNPHALESTSFRISQAVLCAAKRGSAALAVFAIGLGAATNPAMADQQRNPNVERGNMKLSIETLAAKYSDGSFSGGDQFTKAIRELVPQNGSPVCNDCGVSWQVGMRVYAQVANPSGMPCVEVNDLGVIVSSADTGQLLVEWDGKLCGHDGNGNEDFPSTPNFGQSRWYVTCQEIAPLVTPTTIPVLLSFAGLPDYDRPLAYYDGGLTMFGVGPGPDYGANFYADTPVYIYYNGCCNPSPGVIALVGGDNSMLINLDQPIRALSYYFSSNVSVTLRAYSGPNGTGSVVSTSSFVANNGGGYYVHWTPRNWSWSADAKSIVLDGLGNYWGLDDLVYQYSPCSTGDCNQNGVCDTTELPGHDCNGNSILDSCEIANGSQTDCNGNGIPDSCDITASGVTHVASFTGATGTPHSYTENGITFTSGQDHVHLEGGYIHNHTYCCTTPIIITANVPVFSLKSLDVLYVSGNTGTVLVGSNGHSVTLSSVGTVNLGTAFLDVAWVAWEEHDSDSNLDNVRIAVGPPTADCNGNGVLDSCEIANGSQQDCNGNGRLDSCDLASGTSIDCNGNGVPDSCDIASGAAADCNGNAIPDSCDLQTGSAVDCNGNGTPDNCDIANGSSNDQNGNGIPDGCEPDCNGNGIPDLWEVAQHLSPDCNHNGLPDSCDIASGLSDCDSDGVPDNCELASGSGADCNGNGILDNCDIATGAALDCNQNAVPDSCDLSTGTAIDCNGNSVPDSCDLSAGTALDCNGNSIPDSCDLSQGTPDCNSNGIPDSCDISSGADPDPEGDGIPNSCEPASGIRMVGPAEANPNLCAAIGDDFLFDVFIDNPPFTVVAGQFALAYDRTVLQFVEISAGEAPFTYIPLTWHDENAGTILFVASVPEGGVGTLADSRVARLKFRAIANDCDGSVQVQFNPAAAPVLIANNGGNSAGLPLTGPASVRIITGNPVLTNVPADLNVPADAGAGCQATRVLNPPTATADCGTATLGWVRSDGQPLNAPWQCGMTTVTWIATDICGHVTNATTSVMVNPYHIININIAYAGTGYSASMMRCIHFNIGEHAVASTLTFSDGLASVALQIPVALYTCATADDDLHSMVARAFVHIQGTQYTAVFAGSSALINGDLNDDNLIDVTDWGIAVVRINGTAPIDTDCSYAAFHPDFNGDGLVQTVDGEFILGHFLAIGEFGCTDGGGATGGSESISVADLAVIIGSEATNADLNGDAMVDRADIDIWVKQNSGH